MAKAVRLITKKHPDAELIDLGRRISEVRVRERESDKECSALLDSGDDAALEAAEARNDAITAELCVLHDRMLNEKPPKTLAGFVAIGLAIVQFCWNDKIEDFGPTGDHQGIRMILSGLTGIPLPVTA
jgi:hypothetical protein